MADNNDGGSAPAIAQSQSASQELDAHTVQDASPVLEGEATQRQPSIFDNWLLWAVAALWLWYLFGNKKRKQAKQAEQKERARRDALQRGDNIVTIGRMHGKVVSFTDKTVTVLVDPKSNHTMTFDREAIFRVLPRPGEGTENAAAEEAAEGKKDA